MTIVQVTAQGETHGLLRELPNSVKLEQAMQRMPEEKRADYDKRRKDAAKIVEAQYVNHTNPEGVLEKPYCQFAGDRLQIWKFINGYVYKVPKGLVEEVNESFDVQRPTVEHDLKGQPRSIKKKIHSFVPIKW